MANQKASALHLAHPPVIAAWAAAGGKREAEGPLADGLDLRYADNRLEKPSWEKAEAQLLEETAYECIRKGGTTSDQIQLALSGDLQAQCTASSYTMRQLGVPYIGLYGACSTMAEGLALGACLSSAGAGEQILAMTASHFCAAERQFRMPLDYGGMRTPTAQWTATAAGCVLLRQTGKGVTVPTVTFGRVQDLEIRDITNMGAAMAPAAADTLLRYFADTGTTPTDFDAIFTGDLGQVGSSLLEELMQQSQMPVPNHKDCGCLLYGDDPTVGAGGSGCGCSAAVLCSHILPELMRGGYHRVLFVATGALMSQATFLQSETIPGIAHLVELCGPR